jgi:hypothetical protein
MCSLRFEPNKVSFCIGSLSLSLCLFIFRFFLSYSFFERGLQDIEIFIGKSGNHIDISYKTDVEEMQKTSVTNTVDYAYSTLQYKVVYVVHVDGVRLCL